MTNRVVHQFPISHFCEKTRWHLDAKKLAYKVNNRLPGLHLITNRRISRVRTVPILEDAGHVVADSTAIALYLEERYPERPLLPGEPSARQRVLQLDAYFNDTFGVEVRRLCYGHALRSPRRTRELFFHGYGSTARSLGAALLGPGLELQLRRMYQINATTLQHAHDIVEGAMERLEQEIARSKSGYLVGDALSLADVSAASLLAPLVGPPGSAWEQFPEELAELHAARARARARRAGKWVLQRYQLDR